MLNRASIIGHLGRDPEIRMMQNGEKVANLSVATSERWKDKQSGEQKEKTEWHRCVVFGRSAEYVEKYLKKGAKVFLEGQIETRKYTDQAGVEKYSTEIVVRQFGGKLQGLDKREEGPADTEAKAPPTRSTEPADLDDDIPF